VAAARAAARSVAADVGVLEAQLAQAQARLDALGAAVAEAAEAYNGAVYELERARAAAADAAARAAAAGADLDAARGTWAAGRGQLQDGSSLVAWPRRLR